jgi:hypothetical protein
MKCRLRNEPNGNSNHQPQRTDTLPKHRRIIVSASSPVSARAVLLAQSAKKVSDKCGTSQTKLGSDEIGLIAPMPRNAYFSKMEAEEIGRGSGPWWSVRWVEYTGWFSADRRERLTPGLQVTTTTNELSTLQHDSQPVSDSTAAAG